LDGVPAVARELANRAVLRTNPGDHGRNLLDRLEAAEYAVPPGPPLLLMGVDTELGRAIVAVGDPNHAMHTCVLVPGVNTTLDDMPGQINRANKLSDEAQRISGGEPVSVVAWLGYGAPGFDEGAADHHAAALGAPLLDRFVDGLHSSHDASVSAHTSVLGHSYGSTVVGEAAHDGNGLAVDDIITAGSPGMDVGSVKDLHVDPHHVWAGAADDDFVPNVLGRPGVHGDVPNDVKFGANQYHVDTSGHSGYWDPASESLRNQARIIAGAYDRVTLDHGQLP
jgi:hypothetical protein